MPGESGFETFMGTNPIRCSNEYVVVWQLLNVYYFKDLQRFKSSQIALKSGKAASWYIAAPVATGSNGLERDTTGTFKGLVSDNCKKLVACKVDWSTNLSLLRKRVGVQMIRMQFHMSMSQSDSIMIAHLYLDSHNKSVKSERVFQCAQAVVADLDKARGLKITWPPPYPHWKWMAGYGWIWLVDAGGCWWMVHPSLKNRPPVPGLRRVIRCHESLFVAAWHVKPKHAPCKRFPPHLWRLLKIGSTKSLRKQKFIKDEWSLELSKTF